MTFSRRRFLWTSALAMAAGALPANRWATAGEAAGGLRELRASVGIFSSRGGTIGWLTSTDAMVVVDSQFPESAAGCLTALRGRTDHALDALINTHHHGDHTAGNGTLRKAARKIVAHENVPRLQRQAAERRGNLDDQTYADTTFSEEWRLDAGGQVVSARHYGPAHTGGDCVVHFHEANVAHVGDLVFNRFHPFIDRAGGASIAGWVETLGRILSDHDDDTLYVFGHGQPGFGVTGSGADIALQRDYLEAVLEYTRKGIAAGDGVDGLAAIDVLPGFEDHEPPGSRFTLEANVRVAYQELTDAPR
jgi:glyoxylase-like metal-dependent hydrolase (beta-lactamase superfamily II)